jgi:hypothetical protein
VIYDFKDIDLSLKCKEQDNKANQTVSKTIITPYIPFPNIYWWAIASSAKLVCFDKAEHFHKMSYRNRYYLSGSNGLVQLSIPLQHGRDQRTSMGKLSISNTERWQVQHWRTLFSVYNRSPYFEHYAISLEKLFTTRYNSLIEFNLASVHWLKEQLKLRFEEQYLDEYNLSYDGPDLRKNFKPGIEKKEGIVHPAYYQVFADRIGFLPNLSMLDLLFSEGPNAMGWINQNREEILGWVI